VIDRMRLQACPCVIAASVALTFCWGSVSHLHASSSTCREKTVRTDAAGADLFFIIHLRDVGWLVFRRQTIPPASNELLA
jgi:hypothetical protein